jgi:hypothetical protein
MPRPYNYRPEWRTYLLRRGWLLGGLLLMLCALGTVEYHWIDEVVVAERERAAAVLSASLVDLKTEFDFEVTRAIAVFSLGTAGNEEYSVRRARWLRQAPYPRLLLGVYAIEIGPDGAVLKPLVPGDPMPSSALQTDFAKQAGPFNPAMSLPAQACSDEHLSGPAPLPPTWFVGREINPERNMGFASGRALQHLQSPVAFTHSGNGIPGSPVLWDITLAGNPAFAFGLNTRSAQPLAGGFGIARSSAVRLPGMCGPDTGAPRIAFTGAGHWGVAVFDVNYVITRLLPELLRRHLPGSPALDYDIRIIDNHGAAPGRILFPASTPASEADFIHPDWHINLFAPRIDCLHAYFGPSSATEGPGALNLAQILTGKPASCPTEADAPAPAGLWTLQVFYRPPSVGGAMATFRRRSVLFSCGVLLVLGVSVFTLILLSERASALAEMRTELM